MLYNELVQIKLFVYWLKRPYHLFKTGIMQALPAMIRYRFPQRKLQILVVTGTDGKTTTATLLYHILKQSKKQVGLVSTVAAYMGDQQSDTGFHVTSPPPQDLYRFMRQLVDQKYSHLVLEVTSHGAYQFRNWGIFPTVAGLTNISREHLDYHVTYNEYVKAKLLVLKSAKQAIVNKDDYSYAEIRRQAKGHSFASYSVENELPKKVSQVIKLRFPETYNQMNARLAYRMAQLIEISDEDIAKAIKTFPHLPGRMEVVVTHPCRVIVDFAHTPRAVDETLSAVRKTYPRGKLIAVLGAAGKRDFKKRPEMGRVAAHAADQVVFTAEDPRTEDVWSIIRQMKEGLTEHHRKITTIIDRKQAIQFAIQTLASSNQDTVIVLGKGHEKSMCFGNTEYPWSDQDAIQEIIKSLPVRK